MMGSTSTSSIVQDSVVAQSRGRIGGPMNQVFTNGVQGNLKDTTRINKDMSLPI